jgi:hypothetical protein
MPDSALFVLIWVLVPILTGGLLGTAVHWLLREVDETMPKTPWEDRVRMLLNKPEIVWYYKAPDGKMYGGQPRLDFVACDIFGRFIMIEVKSLPSAAKTFDPNLLVPAVQQDALDKIAGTASGVAILAVGHEDILRLYSWGKIRGLTRISFGSAGEQMPFWMDVWKGPASWSQHNLHVILVKKWHPEPGPYSGLGPLTDVIPYSTWATPSSVLPVPESRSLILPPGMKPRPIAPTRTGFDAMMYATSTVRPTLEPIQNPVVKRAKPDPKPAPPPEKTSGEKRKEILKKANRQHHARQ